MKRFPNKTCLINLQYINGKSCNFFADTQTLVPLALTCQRHMKEQIFLLPWLAVFNGLSHLQDTALPKGTSACSQFGINSITFFFFSSEFLTL